VLRECMPGVSVEEVQAATEAGIVVSEDVRFMTNEELL
jgi:acyl CoA:acetate/3-ketoacid CoA transferase beta subunit